MILTSPAGRLCLCNSLHFQSHRDQLFRAQWDCNITQARTRRHGENSLCWCSPKQDTRIQPTTNGAVRLGIQQLQCSPLFRFRVLVKTLVLFAKVHDLLQLNQTVLALQWVLKGKDEISVVKSKMDFTETKMLTYLTGTAWLRMARQCRRVGSW